MPRVVFTAHLRELLGSLERTAPGRTVGEVLAAALEPAERGYVLDDQGAVRKHVAIFVDGDLIRDRTGLSDPVPEDGEVHVLQALSGG